MDIICHRINTCLELKKLEPRFGVEIDLRDGSDEEIYLEHAPFVKGESFENYLKNYHHGIIVLNIKSERIEEKVIELLKKYNVKNYFFLDSSFPMIMQMIKSGETNIALRYSDYEGMDTLIKMQGKVKWVWVDCFEKFPLDKEAYSLLKELGYKLCFVSPELQGRNNDIDKYKNICREQAISFDAVCTKQANTSKWK